MALRVAVYGSLRDGMGNHSYFLKDNAVKVSTEVVSLPFEMLDLGGFPGLAMSDKMNDMVVEVYEVDEKTYKAVERLEGYPSFYNRQPIETSVGTADVYYLNHADSENSRYLSRNLVSRYDNAYDWVKHLSDKRSGNLKQQLAD